MRHCLLAALSALAVTACSTSGGLDTSGPDIAPPVFDGGRPVEDACGARARTYLVGQQVAEVDLGTLARDVRVIGPDTAVTEDYRPERLNLDVSGAGVILRPWCG
ncbi:I78 family peptidase inhibitor [Maricaulis sp.]|jgi:hypothetical protein|uniref:I78 family peptidase inhibitor n=1 Tax=Maricaulis sp. TaxID=1486257 RepID=UPI0026207F59|nr:I78 family peptidase inhibitor [Maricaulis sp.]